jgi:phosphoglycolate phosphatase-like HAD superfamily hydrolase
LTVSPPSTVVLDLDGPILECKARHYACYRDVCGRHGLNPLTPDEYWKRKRRRADSKDIFRASGATGDEELLLRSWIERVEEQTYLALDTLQPGAHETLAFWAANGARLLLATLRRNPDGLQEQLDSLGLTHLFEGIVVCDPSLGAKGKADAVARRARGTDLRASTWIGDTEVDADAAGLLQCSKVFLVTCGIRDEESLRSLNVGEVIENLAAARALIGIPSS